MTVKSLYPIIASENPDATVDFYKKLGFEKKHELTTLKGNRVFVLSSGELEIEVIEAVKGGPAEFPVGLCGLRVNVDDIDEAYSELKANGCTVVAAPFETGVGKNMIVKDNNGTSITLIQHIKKN